MANKRRHVLPSAAWVNGGNIQIPVKDLPPLARVRAFVFRLEGLFTTGAAAAAVVSSQLHRLIQMIDIGPELRGSGIYWHFMEWMMHGGEVSRPAGLPAANAEAHRRHITWVVPLADDRAWAPLDGLRVGADFNEKVISIDTAAFAGLGAGTWDTLASIAGVLRCEAILDDPNDTVGAIVKYGFGDLTGQAPSLGEPGIITDLFVYRENGATISSAQLATAAIQLDGNQYHDAVRHSEYARAFNDALARGAETGTDSATVPVASEALSETPAVAAGSADTVTNNFLPLIHPARGYKLTAAPRYENSLRVDFTGTDVTFRVGYRKILPHSEASAVQSFMRRGLVNVRSAMDFAAKTESKLPLKGDKAHAWRFLPLRGLRSR